MSRECHWIFMFALTVTANAVAQTPRPASNPRQSVFGVYSVRQRVGAGGASDTTGIPGVLVLGEHDVGWLAVQTDSLGEPLSYQQYPSVFPVCAFSGNSAGQLLLDVCGGGEGAYDGFQTDDGLFFRRETRLATGERLHTDMTAVPTRLPLSNATGLYTLSVRTTFFSGKRASSDYTDWRGTAAVVVGRGLVRAKELFVDMYLENADGGSTGASLRGLVMPDSSFDLESRDSTKTYAGLLKPGRLVGTWRDIRGKDRFEGTLVARRQ